MIKIETKYVDYENGEADFGIIEYDIQHSNMIEHLSLIVFLMEQIQEQDESMTEREIFKYIKRIKKMFMKGEKHGKRDNENK